MATTSTKLEDCEVCNANEAKYTCPKCEVRTCGLTCVNIHKKELNCDGIRDKTKFIPLHSFTDLDLLSDYRFLEDVGRSVENFRKNPVIRYTQFKNLPVHLERLKNVASNKGINLQFMPQNFSKHKRNTTFLNWKTKEFFWRIEFIFSQAENTKWTFERVLDSKRLSVLLETLLNPSEQSELINNESLNELSILRKKLKFYQAHGLSGLRALLKAERVEKSDSKFYDLDFTLSLKENLKNRIIIEFPVIYIIFKDHSDMFEIIESDEEEIEPMPIETTKNTKTFKNGRNYSKFERNRRKYPRNRIQNQSSLERKKGTSVNYFFNSDVSDSENENCDQNKSQELYIPDYNELVKIEY